MDPDTSSSAFRYSEARFAEISGMSRADAKYFRDQSCEEGEHWRRKNGEIALNIEGVKRIWRQLVKKPLAIDLAACVIQNGSGRKTIVLGQPRTATVSVVPGNPNILHARDVFGQDYVVRRPKGEFWVGVELELEPDNQPGLWRVVGSVPRFIGDRAYKSMTKK